MLCYDYTEKRLDTWPLPWVVQPKLEGDRCRAVRTTNGWLLYSSTALVRTSVPHINAELNQYYNDFEELDGELFCKGLKHEEIRSIVSKTIGVDPDHWKIQFHVFDVLDGNNQLHRAGRLLSIEETQSIKRVPTYFCKTKTELTNLYERFIDEGYEGIIIRNPAGLYKRSRSTDIMKLKPRNELDALVVELIEEVDKNGNPKGALGAIVCKHPGIKKEFAVGTGFTREQRIDYWAQPERILGKTVEINYQSLTEESIKMCSFKRVKGDYSFE